jgi:magnesium-transporting ATPase (P-type)
LPEKGFSWTQVLLRQFRNPVSGILFAAAIVAGFFGQFEQSIAISAMICLSVILGFYNEYKAEKTVQALRQSYH